MSLPSSASGPVSVVPGSIRPSCAGYLRNHFPSMDVDDVVQESYLKLLNAKIAGATASTKAYIFSIARNTTITLYRRWVAMDPAFVERVTRRSDPNNHLLPQGSYCDVPMLVLASGSRKINRGDAEAVALRATFP